MKRNLFLSFCLASLCCFTTFAQEAPKNLSVDDTEAITKALGTEITVEGKVHDAFWFKNQVLMITFREEKDGFIAVSFAKHRIVLDEGFQGDTITALKGKTVQITGTVSEHNHRPQIVIEKAEQVKITD